MQVLVRWLWLGTLLLLPFGAGAGSYFYYHPETGDPLQWEPDANGHVHIAYTVDAGFLGRLTHDQAVSLFEMAMGAWEEVANVEFISDPELPVTPEVITLDNYKDYLVVDEHICGDNDQEDDARNTLQWQRKSVIGFDNTNREIIDDVDGLGGNGNAYGITNTTCIDGTSSDPRFLTSAQVVLDGAAINGTSQDSVSDITVNRYFGTMIHELGHFLGLDHASTNQALAQAIDEGELDKEQYARYLSTMSIILAQHEDRATLNPDDIAAIQALYPLPTSPISTVSGTITDASGQPFRGANLELRNIDDPLCEVFSFVSGKECTPLYVWGGDILSGISGTRCGSSSPNTGSFLFRAIPPGRYILEVSEVLDEYKGGVIHPFPNDDRAIPELPGEAEFYNTNDQAVEDPYAYTIIEVTDGSHTTDITVTLSNTVPDGDGIENVIPYTYYLDNPDFGDSLENPNSRCQPNTTDYAAAIGVEELVGVSTTPPPSTPNTSSASGGGGCSLSVEF